MNSFTFLHICDVLAIPAFILLIYYMINKSYRTLIENLLLLLGFLGLIIDLYSSYIFVTTN